MPGFRRLAPALLPFVFLALTACPPIYGLSSPGERPMRTHPDSRCVLATLEATPGVARVEVWGPRDSPQWVYYAGEHHAWVMVTNGRYLNQLLSRSPIAEETRAALLPLMQRIDERLERECGLPPMPPARTRD